MVNRSKFTMIPNEFLEAVCRVNLSEYQSRIFWFLVRKTLGYRKDWDWISLGQFQVGTHLDRSNIHRTLKGLEARNMVGTDRTNPKKPRYQVNQDISTWVLSPETTGVVSSDNRVLSPATTEVLSPETDTKETLTKETLTKEIRPKKTNSEGPSGLARLLGLFPKVEHEQPPEEHKEKLAQTRRFFLPDGSTQIWITPTLPANTVKILEDGADGRDLIFLVGGPVLQFDRLSSLYDLIGKPWCPPDGEVDPRIESKPLPASWLTALGVPPRAPVPRRQKRVQAIPPDQVFADVLVGFFRAHPVEPDAIRRFPLDHVTDVWLCPGGMWPGTPTITRGAQVIHLVAIPEGYDRMALFFASELRQFAALPHSNGSHATDDRLVKGQPLPDTWVAMLRAAGVAPSEPAPAVTG